VEIDPVVFCMLPKRHRLKKTRDFEEVFRGGRSIRSNGIALKIKATQNKTSRFAVVVSKKVSLKAVVRNRIRRLLSEVIQEEAEKIVPGLDAVFVVLPGFKAENLAEAKRILAPLFSNLNK